MYNALYNGLPFAFGYQEGFTQTMAWLRVDGMIGLFLSPSRGLFIFSPFLMFAIYGAWQARCESARLFYFCAEGKGVGVVVHVFSATFVQSDFGSRAIRFSHSTRGLYAPRR
jgi:hypothetical protein